MYFDTHAHYDDGKFTEDREIVLRSLASKNVGRVINPGCDIGSTAFARALSHEYDFLYYAAGIHPEELDGIPDDYADQLSGLADDGKCVAIGEIGLDYYWDSSHKEQQKNIFAAQLHLAQDLGLPVIIHDRDAHGDCLEMVRGYVTSGSNRPGVFHCFSGSAEMAEELLKRGWYLGFDGPVTYKNARRTLEVLEITPLDRILIETDSPYMPPVPKRGERNDSGNLFYIAEKIAEIKKETHEKIADISFQNACSLFKGS